ncbi:MAG: hypothetical protein ACU83N_05785 [Gammaproteobacteria bacterium]
MNIMYLLFRYFALTKPVGTFEPFESLTLSQGEAEFVEALTVSFLIVCVYLLFWLKNKGPD